MISYGNIDITPTRVPEDVQVILDQWWHGHRIEEFERTGYFTGLIEHLPIDNPPRTEPPRIGVLSWPSTASRWATCHFILDDGRLDQIRTVVGSPATAKPLVIDDGTTSVTADMWMVGTRPIGQREAGKDLYLVTLVDERWWWWHSGDQQAPAAPASWSALLDDLFDSVGVASPTIDTIHADYGTPDADAWAIGYRPIPLIIDAACMTVGLRCIRQLDGTVTCQSYANAATADDTHWTSYRDEVLTGGRIEISDIVRSMPESVQVVFENGATNKTLASLALSEFSGLSGVADRAGRIRGDGDTVAAYATQAAKDWYKWGLSRTDATFRGVVARPITGLDDRLEWVHLPGDGGIVTRVIRPPWGERNTWSGVLTATDEDPGGGGGGGECTGHGWMMDAKAHEDASTENEPKRIMAVRIFDGVGRCECISDQPTDAQAGGYLPAIFNTITGFWHVLPMVESCCSCGRMEIEFLSDEGRTDVEYFPAQTRIKLIQSCDDEIAETYYVRRMCATEECYEFALHGAMLCTDDPVPIPCDNTARGEVCCQDCDIPNVECTLCCGCEASPYWTFNLSGFADALTYLNGFWALPYNGDCMWSLSCGGTIISLVIEFDDPDIVITLNLAGAATYELVVPNVNTIDCSINRVLTRTAGDEEDTPASVTAIPWGCDGLQSNCYGEDGAPAELWAVFHDCTFDFTCLNGTIIPLAETPNACGPGTNGYAGSIELDPSCLGGGPAEISLCCTGTCQWLSFPLNLGDDCSVDATGGFIETVSCSPLVQEWRFTNLCALGTAFFTITAVDPT